MGSKAFHSKTLHERVNESVYEVVGLKLSHPKVAVARGTRSHARKELETRRRKGCGNRVAQTS